MRLKAAARVGALIPVTVAPIALFSESSAASATYGYGTLEGSGTFSALSPVQTVEYAQYDCEPTSDGGDFCFEYYSVDQWDIFDSVSWQEWKSQGGAIPSGTDYYMLTQDFFMGAINPNNNGGNPDNLTAPAYYTRHYDGGSLVSTVFGSHPGQCRPVLAEPITVTIAPCSSSNYNDVGHMYTNGVAVAGTEMVEPQDGSSYFGGTFFYTYMELTGNP
ncbi:MAG: hypothetical protein M0Z34_11165 [Nitrospiraceae bacterium]|nr:hypothetical protein [Nitrospiraceae bacterium]